MCGFIGKIGPSDPELLKKGLPWISRRGPDSQRIWASADGRVAILFARLAIVDRDPRAHQPLTNEDAGVTVGMVGEIYNYRELRPRFPNYAFRSDSDTELILAAYVKGGAEGLSLLKGMFAFVLVDERKRRVILVRDAVGKKPLFLAKWGESVHFGSSLLPLIAASGASPELESEQVAHYWNHSFVHPGRTVLKGSRPVAPGRRLELDWEGNTVMEATCEPEAERIYDGEPLEQIIQNVGGLLRNAVARRLTNNPNPVVLLSGGIDSTVIAEVALGLSRQDSSVRSSQMLSLGSLVPMTHDERFARHAARRLDTPLQVLRPSLNHLDRTVVRSLDLQDEPLGMPSYFLLERLTAASSRYGRVLLSGDGGDEVFLGYGKPADWLANNDVRHSTPDIRDPLIPCAGPLPVWMSGWARYAVTVALVGHMFAKADRATAEQGVELRCPLLDWDLVRYARSLPYEALVHGGTAKSLLKDQLAGWPRGFLERPKAGFTYNLRWLWGLSGYAGMREHIDPRSLETFSEKLPESLWRRPEQWGMLDIFRNFDAVWRLLAWSRFLARKDEAAAVKLIQ